MVVEDMASMPPRNKLSVLLQSKRRPGRMPIAAIFLIENSKPSENMRKITPMLLHVSIELWSCTVGM